MNNDNPTPIKINLKKYKNRTQRRGYLRYFKWISLIVVAVAVIFVANLIGSHPQWQTAHQIQSISKKVEQRNKHHPVVQAEDVQATSAKKGVDVDYSGTGGLDNKKELLRLANSNQSEILRGHVAVPSFNISEPIYEGTSNHVLAIGVGINAPNQRFGQGRVTLFGHNMGDYNVPSPYKPTKFSALQNMTEKTVIGKAIYVSDGNTVYKYKAVQLDYGINVKNFEQSLTVPNSGKPKIQLVACLEDQQFWEKVRKSNYTDYTASKRIVLTGELVGQQSYNSVSQSLEAQLK